MGQAVLIARNEMISSLYEVNLRAYVGVHTTCKRSVSSAVDMIEHVPAIDAVIYFFDESSKADEVIELSQHLQSLPKRIPLIVLGPFKYPEAKVILLENRYDIKALLQRMAKLLEITAAQMASKAVAQYFPIPVELFPYLDKSHCDVYVRSENEKFEYVYLKVLSAEEAVANNLEIKDEYGGHLYIDSNERLRFINRASAAIVSDLESNDLQEEESLAIASHGMGFMAEELAYSEEVTEEIVKVSKACIQAISQVTKECSNANDLLTMLLESKDEYVYQHSVLATFISNKIIDHMSWGSKEQQEKVAFSLFFHDLFLVPIYKRFPNALGEEDLLFNEGLTEQDKEVIIDHAKLAGQFLKNYPRCPMGADMLVTQHHGMTGGQGFAVNYKDDISPLAKVMIIAEEVTMTIIARKRKEGDFRMNNQFRDLMAKQLAEKFKATTYRKLVDAFSCVNF